MEDIKCEKCGKYKVKRSALLSDLSDIMCFCNLYARPNTLHSHNDNRDNNGLLSVENDSAGGASED